MAHARTLDVADTYEASSQAPRFMRRGAAVGLLGFVGIFLLAPRQDGYNQLLHSYLLALMFFLSIGIGALFLVILQHLTKAGWSVVVRRPLELMASTLPLIAFLFLPVLISMLVLHNATLFPWVDVERVAKDHLLQGKAAYLNVPFFLARFGLYTLIWTLLSQYFLRASTRQDHTGDWAETARMQRAAAPAMAAFGLSTSFCAFDMLMSLEPHWFSTIFGVYFFAGAVMSALASTILMLKQLQRWGILVRTVTTEHFHDLGKLMFGFVFFWGYIAFSQFMLIWYGNIPEETEWFLHRIHGPWMWVSLALLFGHFLIPFPGLMSRHVKRNSLALQLWCVWLLGMHALDLYWLIMPSTHAHTPPLGLLDLACFVGVGGFFAAGVAQRARSLMLVPARDPRLGESLAFENM